MRHPTQSDFGEGEIILLSDSPNKGKCFEIVLVPVPAMDSGLLVQNLN